MQLPSRDDLFNYYQAASSKVKQYVRNITPLEQKVMDATSNEKWGPHGTVMAEITQSLYNPDDFKQIVGILAKRMQDEGEDWRHVYKSLLLMEYMCKHGPQRIVDELNSNLYIIERLQRFDYKDKNGKDWGLNVRQRAKELYSLITDGDRLRQERQKAKQNESKYTGVSADEARMGKGFGSSWSDRSNDRGYASGSIASQGFGSNSMSYQERDDNSDFDPGHQPLRFDGSDEDEDTKVATKKRIAALKVDAASPARKGSPLKGGRLQAVESEARGPMRLSQVQIDPSIAATFGRPKQVSDPRVATPSVPATQAPAEPSLLFDEPSADTSDTAQTPPPPSAADDGWDAFMDTQPAGTQAHASNGLDDLLGGPTHLHPSQLSGPALDPFSLGGQVQTTSFQGQTSSSAAADPFSGSGIGSSPKATGTLPLAPQKKEEADPFASISGANFASRPQALNELRRNAPAPVPAAQRVSSPTFSSRPGGNTETAGDLFSMPLMPSSPQLQPPHAGGSVVTSLPDAAFLSGSSIPAWPSSTVALPDSHKSTEDLFQSMGLSSTQNLPGGKRQALGGGNKMAPDLPQPNLPPPVSKKDPFAGLAGF